MTLRFSVAALLLMALSGCGSYSSSPTMTSPTPTASGSGGVSIVSGASARGSSAYAPNPISVAVGGTVTWINNDSTTHTATSDTGAWNSGNIAPGASFSRTFPSAGTFPYHCVLHPGMVGTVTVQ